MKVYRRLLVYAKPYGRFIIPFFAFNLLAVFFGVFQFTLIIPLLDFLFNDHSAAELKKYATAPEFSFSASYFKDFFLLPGTPLKKSRSKVRVVPHSRIDCGCCSSHQYFPVPRATLPCERADLISEKIT